MKRTTVLLGGRTGNLNILRKLRLQLKSGYLKKEPASYLYMKRYPPLMRDTAPIVNNVNINTIPYMKLYKDAVDKNPIYADERVYPAYWQHEPQALTLAKKQYELMQNGINENDAYNQALEYVEVLEDKAYDNLKIFLSSLNNDSNGINNIKKPWSSDMNIVNDINKYHEKLKHKSYHELELHEQGDIDYIIQTKILKWNEVDRERRMKDPVFNMQFDKLRKAIFPEIKSHDDIERLKNHDITKDNILTIFNVNKDKLCTQAPFYFDDYTFWFNKLKLQPLLIKWSELDREGLSRWIIDVLAYREVLEKSSNEDLQKYLDDLRAHFFPMVKYPEKSHTFNVPKLNDMKAILYNNDIGYKTITSKLYIKRFYKLPVLLFPTETFTTSMLTNQERLRSLLNEENGLLQEMQNAGLDEAALPELQRQLNQYLTNYKAPSGTIDMASLDALLKDDDNDEDEVSSSPDVITNQSNDNTEISITDEESLLKSEAAWIKAVTKHYKFPTTTYGDEREQFFRGMDVSKIEEAEDEVDLSIFQKQRAETEVQIRARLGYIYENKEAARRVTEWKTRGVMMDDLPPPPLPLA